MPIMHQDKSNVAWINYYLLYVMLPELLLVISIGRKVNSITSQIYKHNFVY